MRHIPKAGAVCGNPARTDLRGGQGVTFVPTATPVDAIVETDILEFHGEKRGDLYFTKDMLLAIGDRFEAEIAVNRAIDAKYR